MLSLTRSHLLCRTEPLCRMGAHVLGVDAAERSVFAARAHAARDPLVSSLASYRAAAAEELVSEGRTFDAVLSLEVMEHAADVPAFAATLGSLVIPDGLLLLSTINRTVRSYALGILAAEQLLGLVPRGTHDWSRFLTPQEVAGASQATGVTCHSSLTLCGRLPRQECCWRLASRWSGSQGWSTLHSADSGVSPPTRPSTTSSPQDGSCTRVGKPSLR